MAADQKQIINWTVQAVVAFALVAALYYASTYATMKDRLIQVTAADRVTGTVVRGLVVPDTRLGTDSRIKTSGRTIVPLPPSKNQNGGVQFSFSFWLKLPPLAATGSNEFRRVVLLRGDTAAVPWVQGETAVKKTLPLAFCPMVIVSRVARAAAGGRTLHDVVVSCHVNTFNDRNFAVAHKLVDGESPANPVQWNLVTVTVADAFAYASAVETSTSCSVWVNQVQASATAPVAMGGVRLNSGDLFLLPAAALGDVANRALPGTDVQLRDVTYANYAMTAAEIYDKLAAEANKAAVPYQVPPQSTNKQAYWDLTMARLSP